MGLAIESVEVFVIGVCAKTATVLRLRAIVLVGFNETRMLWPLG
jgi:hypothetical protein